MPEFRADGIGCAGTLLGRQYLHCPTTSTTTSFSNLRVAGAHTIWAYVIDDASWQDVPGTEAYAQFTVDPGDPPPAPGGPAPSLSNTGGGGAPPSTGGQAVTPAPAGQSRSQAAPAGAPAATNDSAPGSATLVAGPPPPKAVTSTPAASRPQATAAFLPAVLARMFTAVSNRELAVPVAAAGLAAPLAGWVFLGLHLGRD